MIWMEKMIGDPARAEEKPDPLIPYPEPKDLVIASNPPFPVRIAFVEGAAGESIELFCEK